MPYNTTYSLGVYVDNWWGGNGMPPHIFIGLKIEKEKLSKVQIDIFKQVFKDYENYDKFIKEAENFQQPTTQYQLTQILNSKDIKNKINIKAWLNGEDDKKYQEKRAEFNNNFTFFRICQTDITLKFKEFILNGKEQIETYDEVVQCLESYLSTNWQYLLNIEGFFGFGPYKSAPFSKVKNGDNKENGGKVFQNNQYDCELFNNSNYKNQINPKIPENNTDRKDFIFSQGHILKSIRPLDTFFTNQAIVFENINQDLFYEVVRKILLDTILSNDEFRTKKCFFDKRNTFKDYKVVGNSCVDFVRDKMQIAQIITKNNHSLTPNQLLNYLKKLESKKDKKARAELLLYDVELYYYNFLTLCNIDSTWACEEGLKSFNQYCEFLLHSNLLHHTRLNRLTDNITHNQLKSLARNTEIEHIEDDVNMRLNTHFCLASYFQDRLKYEPHLQTEVALIIYDDEKEHYLKADSQSKFAFSEFSYDRNILSHNIALWYEQPILFAKNPYPLAIQIQENIFDNYPKYFAQCIVGNKKDYGDYRNFLKQEEVSNA